MMTRYFWVVAVNFQARLDPIRAGLPWLTNLLIIA